MAILGSRGANLRALTPLFAGIPNVSLAGSLSTDHADTAWVLICSALVMLMCLPGIAIFYGGLIRRKNVLSVLAQCFAVASIASLLWFFIGFPFAFGEAEHCGNWLCTVNVTASGETMRTGMVRTIPTSAFLMFQMTFAAIAPALSLGGFAERMRFGAVLLYTSLWSVLVYTPVAQWVWGGGWLQRLGALDFAGGIVVHVASGVSALVAALVIGQRTHRHAVTPPHSLPLVAIGGGLLWVGWFGFNGGSALAANEDAASAVLVTHLAACSGALTWMAAEWKRYRKPSISGVLTGAVAALVTITPASGYVTPAAGVVIGAMGSVLAFAALLVIRARFSVDDALDVSPIHGVAGIVGALLTAVFAQAQFGGMGLPEGRGLIEQFGVQCLSCVAVVLWSGGISYLLLQLTDRLVGLRVDELEESVGLDIAEFGESGYDN